MENQSESLTNSTLQSEQKLTYSKWLKVVVLTTTGLFFALVTLFIGIKIGKSQITNQQTNKLQDSVPPTLSPTLLPITTTTLVPNPTQQSLTIDSIENWKTYNNNVDFIFKYPSEWKIISSGTFNSITSPDQLYELSIDSVPNISDSTQKPYNTIKEYIDSERIQETKELVIDNFTITQVYPRIQEGNRVVFFSKNKEYINDIVLNANLADAKSTTSTKDLFLQIISTLSFTK